MIARRTRIGEKIKEDRLGVRTQLYNYKRVNTYFQTKISTYEPKVFWVISGFKKLKS